MVQLKFADDTDAAATIRRFNSCMVQLKSRSQERFNVLCGFNSCMVQLKY